MHCFTVTEKVTNGLLVYRAAVIGGVYTATTPFVETPPGCLGRVLLEEQLYTFIKELGPGIVRLKRASLEAGKDYVLLRRCDRRKNETQCLVEVCLSSGQGGKIFLTANAYDEELVRGRVERKYRPFPGPGVQVLCTDERLAQVNAGDTFADLLLVMNRGASFRVIRTGQMEDGASPQMFVHWNGRELRATVPRRYDEARAAGFFESVPAD